MITLKDLIADYKRNNSYKRCFYHNKANCSNKIKKAHSIQKEKILAQLEEPVNGNNLIYSFDSFTETSDFKTKELVPIGKNKASIFTGFCDYHDSKLFSPLENFDFKFTDEQLFLMTYRAFAHGFHQIVEQYNYYLSDGFYVRLFPKQYLHENIKLTEFWLKKYLVYKKILDNLIETKSYSVIKYHTRIIEPYVPMACSSVLSPFYTYKNKFLNPREEYSYVVLNVLPDFTRTIIILSQFVEDYKGEILFEELKELSDNEFTEAISSLMVYCTSNTFLSPRLWNKFSAEAREQLFREFDFCIMKGDKITEFFRSKINFFKI